MASTAPVINRQELDTVRAHLQSGTAKDTAVWGVYSNGRDRLSTSAGAGLSMSTNGVTLGFDKTFDARNDAVMTTGLFTSFQNSDVDFNRGGNGRVKTSSVGAYADWHKDGWFVNGITKVSQFSNDVNARMTSGKRASGSYDQTGLSGDVQGGYKFALTENAWVAPYVQASLFSANGATYKLSNGMKADVKSVRSATTEGGVIAGYNASKVTPWIKVGTGREFVSNNTESPVTANVGVSWSFK